MKKILLLGGSSQQVIAIKKAKELGYYTILCDFLPDNPGQNFADKFYLLSTTDKESILEVAVKEKINGIVAYASDPAAPTAAYVAEKLNLNGHPYNSVDILTDKSKFREFLQKNNFCTPYAKSYTDFEVMLNDIKHFKLPVLIKPVDSSGSKGISLINSFKDLEDKFNIALNFSRAKKIIIEEFVEHIGYQVAGDGFSVDGKLVFRCFGNNHLDANSANPFVPVSASFPLNMSLRLQEKIHDEIQRLLTLLKMGTGAYNFDIKVDKNENIFLMEVGPRNGGNYIPQIIKYLTGFDMVEHTIKVAMGENCNQIKMIEPKGFYSYYSLHSLKSGILKEIRIDEDVIKNNILEKYINYDIGDKVLEYKGSNSSLGILIMKFKSLYQMLDMMDNSQKWVEIALDGENE